jgi:hypothetical protein
MNRLLRLVVLIGAVFASPVQAQVWTEQGDAGSLPSSAQVPQGQGSLTAILGTIGDPADVDMYCIHIDGNYQASLCENLGLADSRLFLFQRVNGTGLAFIDDVCGREARLGVIQPPSGSYLIAITGYDRDPVSGTPGAAIWLDQPFFTERAPDGPGATGPVTGWSGTGNTGAYVIALSGVSFCQGAAAIGPEAASAAFALTAMVPNPFTTVATLSYELPWSDHVRLRVYDAAGRAVATLADGPQEAGSHSLRWNGRGDSGAMVPAGVYLVGIEVRGVEATRKIVLLR